MLQNKYKMLLYALALDVIGMFSYAVPGAGEYFDVIWAPIAAYIFFKMYPGTEGKFGSIVTFAEELIPFTDVVPTFTLMWIYKYVIQNKNI